MTTGDVAIRSRTVNVSFGGIALLWAAFTISGLTFAWWYGVDWIWNDELGLVSWFLAFHSGQMNVSDIFVLGWTNEHPVAAQIYLFLLVAAINGMHFKALVYLNVFL